MLSPGQFESLVAEAVDSLPLFFQEKMRNIEILIERWPSEADLDRAEVAPGHTLLGLYRGIPLTERTQGYNLVLPDTVTLFQGPIEEAAGGHVERVRQIVRHTVIHEIAHHFGISDARLRQLGAY